VAPRYCDLVLLDLDSDDGLTVFIENKLFTCNQADQLVEYLEAAEEKFSRIPTREYVYLTLRGDSAFPHPGDDRETVARVAAGGLDHDLAHERV
jgi:hypothetical protein